MKAEITGENDERVGMYVYDNEDIEHWIEMTFDGEIKYHEQDGYPDDPEERTLEENEYFAQARRFAKWHVYRECGYDTVPPTENPDRILGALLAISKLSGAAFSTHFGDIECKIKSHYDSSSVEVPFDNADPDDVFVYQKNVYLLPDPTEFDPPVLEQFLGRFEGESDSQAIPEKGALDKATFDALNFDLEAVSEIHTIHNDGMGTEQVHRGTDPLDREPDATVELVPFDLTEIDSFHHYVVSHLAYQIRDQFLLMGVKPPMGFRAQGWGSYKAFQVQKFCDLYENYWSSEATITSWEPWKQ